MRILRTTFIVLAVSCGAAWLTKMVAIAATGGAETDALVVSVLWTIGMLTFLLASATGTALLLHRSPVWARWVAGILAIPVSFVLLNLLDTVTKASYRSDSWFRDELSLVLAGVLLAALGVRMLSGSQRT